MTVQGIFGLGVIVLIVLGFRYLLKLGVYKVSDQVSDLFAKKKGEDKEGEKSNLADRYK